MIEKLKEIVGKYSHKTFYQMGDFSQFTIDTFEQLHELVNDEEREFHENEGLGSVSDLIGSIIYQADTIIEVLKDGKDKEVFEELVKDLRELEENRKNKKVTFKVLPQNGK